MKATTIPKEARRRDNSHLAEGEATGHFHAATAADAVIYDLPGIPDVLALSAPSGTAVTHQEHDTIMVPPGEYDRSIVQEFDHFNQEARAVVD
jgi:hypothetical protein